RDPHARLGWFIVIGSIPAALVGLLYKDFFESLFHDAQAAGFFLLVTAGLLLLSEWIARHRQATDDLDHLTLGQVIGIGLAQATALAPGISRSGSTMAVGLATGLRRDEAARFSFLLGTPAFLGAGLLQLVDALSADRAEVAAQAPLLALGFVVSALAGYVAIRGLLAYLRRHSLYIFAVYCVAMGLLVIGLALLSLGCDFLWCDCRDLHMICANFSFRLRWLILLLMLPLWAGCSAAAVATPQPVIITIAGATAMHP